MAVTWTISTLERNTSDAVKAAARTVNESASI